MSPCLACLVSVLLDLGFTQSMRSKFWYFAHASSETTFTYRPYRTQERVTLLDLDRTRHHLDWRGLMPSGEFDDVLKKATA